MNNSDVQERKMEQTYDPETVRKKRLVRKSNPNPWELLEGFNMQDTTLLRIISDNNRIANYRKIRKGHYFCNHEDFRVILTFEDYDENTSACGSLKIARGKPLYFFEVIDPVAYRVYIESGQLKREKL